MKKKLCSSIYISLLLAGCSGGGGGSTQLNETPVKSAMEIITPNTFVVDGSTTMPIIIKNNSSQPVDASYSFTVNDANIDASNLNSNCKMMAPQDTCQIDLPLSNSNIGTAQLKVTTNNGVHVSGLISIINKSIIDTNGADGVSLYSNTTIINNGNSTNNFIVTAIVGENVGTKGQFNNISLVDVNGVHLPYCSQISGPNMSVISAGSILTYLCQVPNTVSNLSIAPQLNYYHIDQNSSIGKALDNVKNYNVVDTGKVKITVNVVAENVPVTNFVQSPHLVALNDNIRSQKITVINSGNTTRSISSINKSDPDNVAVSISHDSCSGVKLSPSQTCSYQLDFDATQHKSGVDMISLLIGDNNQVANSLVQVNYVENNISTANIAIAHDGLNYISSLFSPIDHKIITVTNSSKFAIFPEKPDLSVGNNYFSISAPNQGNYCYNGNILESNQSCSFLLDYNNANDVGLTSFVLTVPFSYYMNSIKNIYKASIGISYITHSYAQLYFTDENDNITSINSFATIHNDGMESSAQTIYIYNQGNIPATNISSLVDMSTSSLFNIESSNCSGSLNPGQNCTISIKFGPTNSYTGISNTAIAINYLSNSQALQLSQALNGTVINIGAANLVGFITSSTFNGNGTIIEPYKVIQGVAPSPTIKYTLTNIGGLSAESIAVDLANDTGWTISQDYCSSRKIAPNMSCDIILSLQDTTTVGANNLDLGNLMVSWSDSKTQSRINDAQTGAIYATVMPKSSFEVSLQNVAGLQQTTESQRSFLLKPNSSYIFNVNMINGSSSHQVVANVVNASGQATLSTGKCTLTPSVPSCQITLLTADNQLGNGDFAVNFSSDINSDETLINFHTWSGSLPASTIFDNSKSLAVHNGFIYNAAPSDIYRCSVLTNGNVYSCITAESDRVNSNVQKIMFVDDVLLFSNLVNAVSPYSAEWLDNASLDDNGRIIRHGGGHVSSFLKQQGSSDSSGFTSYAVYKDTIYFTQFNQAGLWSCPLQKYLYKGIFPLVAPDFANCKLTTAPGSEFIGNAASLVIGNNLFITQTVTKALHGLNKCQINADGSISSCSNISPTISGDSQSFDGVQHSSGLLVAGGYLYGSQDNSGGSDICPFDGSNIIDGCYFGQAPQSFIITMQEMNGWIYYTKSNGSGKVSQLANGKFTNVGSIVGY